jgi:hypothetical protein
MGGESERVCFIPLIGQRVAMAGRDDEFLVLSVDQVHQSVDLLQLSGEGRLVWGFPHLALRPAPDSGFSSMLPPATD